ncbi:MAG: hypothetical protein JW812_03035 [Alphaproteobacteria bacterium]|nr:hypothetical protein [Alphaproteobacteria bacterium]MBN2779718.1 hypothetical protein [Alphaproteobacteria bacterium]
MLNIYVLENPVQRGATAGAIGLARDLLSKHKANPTCVKTLEEIKSKADILFSISYDDTKAVQDFHKKILKQKSLVLKTHLQWRRKEKEA